MQSYTGTKGLVVKRHVGHAPDHYSRTFHRRARLQSADIVEFGIHLVGVGDAEPAHVSNLERQDQQRADAGTDEQSHPQVEHRAFHHTPRNMNAVNTKSRPRMASDDVTTVRVVAPDTPSAVGGAS